MDFSKEAVCTAVAFAEAKSSDWDLIPSLGNLESYIAAVKRMPMLTYEQEQMYARRMRDEDDVKAAGYLVLSHLRLVVSIARQYLGYGLPHGDLIQEGNIGLMKAVRRFDPSQGVRLVSYALHWIRAEIHEYILKNWRMVKVAATKAQRKLFFNLRSSRQELRAGNIKRSDSDVLTCSEVNAMAEKLQVRREDVLEMQSRLATVDMALENSSEDAYDADGVSNHKPIAWLSDKCQEPQEQLLAHQREMLSSEGISHALSVLDERSRDIVQSRWLHVHDDGSGGKTLSELASYYGISAERVRQIEVVAFKKMKQILTSEYDI